MISLKMKPQDISLALELLGLTTEVWAPLRAVTSHGAAETALATVQRSIHQAFRSRARALHPDHGGDARDFQIVSELKSRIENLKLQRPARPVPRSAGAAQQSFEQRWAEMVRGQQERERERRGQRVVVVDMADFFKEVFAAQGAPQPRAKQTAPEPETNTRPRPFFTTPDPHWNSTTTVMEDLMDAMRVAQGFGPKSGTGEG